MALTEEEKKKKMQQDISLDEWYNTNQQNIERQAQQQYEDAYVNRELMNKYLNQNLASQGLADTGIANLYAQQANTDYMNQRANIANAQQEAETNLFNQYYSEKKAENDKKESAAFNMFQNKVNNALKDGLLTDETEAELSAYLNDLGLGSYYTGLGTQYLSSYTPTQEQRKEISQNEFTEDIYNDISDNIGNEVYDFDTWLGNVEQAYENGDINKTQRDSLNSYIEEERERANATKYDKAAENFGEELKYLRVYDDKFTEETAKVALEKLEKIRSEIGETNYKNLKYEIETSIETVGQKEFRLLKEQGKIANNEPIGVYADVAAFGDFLGVGEGTEQDQYVNKILEMARTNQLKDGDIIDFNYGAGNVFSGNSMYIYHNGKFYKATGLNRSDATISSKNRGERHSTTPTRQKIDAEAAIRGVARGTK